MKEKCVGMVRLNMADRALIDKQRLIDEWEYILDEQEVDICDASFIASVLVDDLIQNAPVVEIGGMTMSAEVKVTVKMILELLDVDQPVNLLNVNESNLPEPPIVSAPEPLLKSLRREILDSAVMKIASASVDGNPVNKIYYEE